MMAQNTQELQKFISDNNLKRDDGIILFRATVDVIQPEKTTRLSSEIEILTLPQEIALYIVEFYGENREKEMYRTRKHQFGYISQNELEILDTESNTRLIISLKKTATPE